MQRKTLDAWVGLFVLLGAAALVFLALKAGNMSSFSLSQTTYAVQTKFDNIAGLQRQKNQRRSSQQDKQPDPCVQCFTLHTLSP